MNVTGQNSRAEPCKLKFHPTTRTNSINQKACKTYYCSVWSHSTHFFTNKPHYFKNQISIHLLEGHFNLSNYPWCNIIQEAHSCQLLKCLFKLSNDPDFLGLHENSSPPWLNQRPRPHRPERVTRKVKNDAQAAAPMASTAMAGPTNGRNMIHIPKCCRWCIEYIVISSNIQYHLS